MLPNILIRWTCRRGRHKWREVKPRPGVSAIAETSRGPMLITAECRRCGLLEGSDVVRGGR